MEIVKANGDTHDPKRILLYRGHDDMANYLRNSPFNRCIYNVILRHGPKQLPVDMAQPSIHVGPGACGSYVVGDEDFMKQLVKEDNRNLKGLDMEGYGLYLAGHMLKKNCVLVKGIADFGDSKKGDKYHQVCSYASAWFVMRYIKKML